MKICLKCRRQFKTGEVFCPIDGVRLVSSSSIDEVARHPEDSLIGVILNDRYKILRRIGEGGMGIIYEAEHLLIEKRVALKALREDISSRQGVLERFRREARSASRIGNPHIVDISDFGETPSGAAYYVMEMLEGEDLADILFREGKLDPARAVKIACQICEALGAAHSKGIVHRDIKPENIFITRRDGGDFVKVVDFGVAKMTDIELTGKPQRKLTKTGLIFGTPEYMSPEHARGLQLDHRVDVYALGIILYESLSGRVPFEGGNFMEVLTKHWTESVPSFSAASPSLHLSDALENVVFKALDKDPRQRYQSMEKMAEDLMIVPEMMGAVGIEKSISVSIPDALTRLIDKPSFNKGDSNVREELCDTVSIELDENVSVQASNKSATNSPVKPSASAPVLRDESAAVIPEQQYPRERLHEDISSEGLRPESNSKALVPTEQERKPVSEHLPISIDRDAERRLDDTAPTSRGIFSWARRSRLTPVRLGVTAVVIFTAVFTTAGYGIMRSGKAPRSAFGPAAHENKTIVVTHLEPKSKETPVAEKNASVGQDVRVPSQLAESALLQSDGKTSLQSVSTVHVTTQPQGARVTVRGRGEVCSSTPCRFETSRAKEISLRAELGQVSATKVFTPSESSMTINFKMASSAGDAFTPGKKTGSMSEPKQQEAHNDLKIPNIFDKKAGK
jgi:serine/threonine protein kinase